MSDPNTPPPFPGHDSGNPHSPQAPQPGQHANQPPQPGQFPTAPPQQYQPPQYGQFPNQPLTPYQQPAQPYAPWNPSEGWIPELGVKVASAGTRIGAKAIDIAFYFILQVILGILTFALIASSTSQPMFSTGSSGFSGNSAFELDGSAIAISIGAGLVFLLIDFVYNVVLTAQYGGTPGKLLLGLRVIRQDGRPVDMGVAFRRWSPIFGVSVLSLVPFVSIIGQIGRFGLLIANLVMVLTDDRRRDVFDHVASTYVISTR